MEENKQTFEKPSKPWLFRKGEYTISGPGRPKGVSSLKDYAKKLLKELPDDQKETFLDSLPKELIWKMGEGNPTTTADIAITNDVNFTPEQIKSARKALGLGPIEIDGGSK